MSALAGKDIGCGVSAFVATDDVNQPRVVWLLRNLAKICADQPIEARVVVRDVLWIPFAAYQDEVDWLREAFKSADVSSMTFTDAIKVTGVVDVVFLLDVRLGYMERRETRRLWEVSDPLL